VPRLSTELTIRAPAANVFATIGYPRRSSEALPHVESITFVGEQEHGPGTRFREVRRMGKQTATYDFDVTEWIENRRTRLVTDSGGTVWDTIFEVTPTEDGAATTLRIAMDARPYRLMPRLIVPLIMGQVRKASAKDLELLKAHIERTAG